MVFSNQLHEQLFQLSEEKRLGKFDEGEVREFMFNANIEENTKVGCLKFTLKDGTDGWTMEKVGLGWRDLRF